MATFFKYLYVIKIFNIYNNISKIFGQMATSIKKGDENENSEFTKC